MTFFSLPVLYQERGLSPNLLWGLGPANNVFSMHLMHPTGLEWITLPILDKGCLQANTPTLLLSFLMGIIRNGCLSGQRG